MKAIIQAHVLYARMLGHDPVRRGYPVFRCSRCKIDADFGKLKASFGMYFRCEGHPPKQVPPWKRKQVPLSKLSPREVYWNRGALKSR